VGHAVNPAAADSPFSRAGAALGRHLPTRRARSDDANSLLRNRFESGTAEIADESTILVRDASQFAGFAEYFAGRRDSEK
jgi:hypothetical protein